jgi:hypothetical protein
MGVGKEEYGRNQRRKKMSIHDNENQDGTERKGMKNKKTD